jgi:hypothetical protein
MIRPKFNRELRREQIRLGLAHALSDPRLSRTKKKLVRSLIELAQGDPAGCCRLVHRLNQMVNGSRAKGVAS